MKRLLVCASAVLFSTAVLAQAPATQRGSGQSSGGPARENISETGGKKAPVARPMRVRSGQSAGGVAGGMVSETGGKKQAVKAPKRAKSGQSSGGPRQ